MVIDTPLINSSFQHLRYLGVYKNMTCFYILVLMLLRASKGQRVVLFLSWLLFFVKNINCITKNASILHLKLGSNRRPSYFPTSNPSRHTPHYHVRPITCGQLLRWRDFDILSILPFLFSYSLVHFSNLQYVYK